MLAFCDNTDEALTGMLRPGNAGSNTAADHAELVDAALVQVPGQFRHGYPILVRFDGASKALLGHLHGLRAQGVDAEYSVGWAVTAREHTAIVAPPENAWSAAVDVEGDPREGAAVAELTGLFPSEAPARVPGRDAGPRPPGTTHPGAQLDLIEEADGWRYTCFVTNTGRGQLAFLDARHRAHAHAHVEDRTRCGKDTGLGRFPSKLFAISQAWLTCALIAIDLVAWTRERLHARPTPHT